MMIREISAMVITAAVATAACESIEPGPWRADSQTSSVVHVPSRIRFPVQAGDFSLTGWEERVDTPPTAVVTYRLHGGNPTVQINLRQWDRPGPISEWVATQGAAAGAADRNPAPRISRVTLAVSIQRKRVDVAGTIIAGDEVHPSQLWIAFPQRQYVALAIMLYSAGLPDQEAIRQLGDLLGYIPWSAPD
jgi:hypothetical protein